MVTHYADAPTRPAMKLVIFGAAGRTGQWLVQGALDAGHEVTAVARRPEAIRANGARLRKIRADLLDADATAAAIAGHDCILSAIGATRALGPTTIFSAGIKNILAGARRANVRRLIVLSSSGVDGETRVRLHIKLFANLVIRPLLFGIYADSARMEGILEATDCDWTVVRPPRLTDGGRTTDYRRSVGEHRHLMASLSRADLADCMLNLIEDASTHRTWVEVTSTAWL